jgi:hypothetical protein
VGFGVILIDLIIDLVVNYLIQRNRANMKMISLGKFKKLGQNQNRALVRPIKPKPNF